MPKRNPVASALRAALDAKGIDHRLENDTNHAALCFEHGGRTHRMAFSRNSGSGDVRSVSNALAQLRRRLAGTAPCW